MNWTNEEWLTYYSDLIRREVYVATQIFETIEGSGLLYGNGHHIRQNLAEHAVDTLKARWIVQ